MYTRILKRTPSPYCKITHIGDQVSAHSHSETQAGGQILSPSHSLDQFYGSGTSLSISHSKPLVHTLK